MQVLILSKLIVLNPFPSLCCLRIFLLVQNRPWPVVVGKLNDFNLPFPYGRIEKGGRAKTVYTIRPQ